jgi:O-antigen ligase
MIRGVERWLGYFLLAPALLPLLYSNGFLYPYVAPKTFAFRTLGICVLAAFLYLALSRREFYFERLRSKWLWIPAALLAVSYITSLLGVDFFHSFWSVFDRGDGLLTFTACVVFFYGVVLTANDVFLQRLARLSLWIGGLVALYAVLQWLQATMGMNFPLIETPRGRYGATFGNAAFMAAYLGMTLFLSAVVAREYRGWWRYSVYASIALQLLAVLLSATRGTVLALGVALALACCYYALKGVGQMRMYARALIVLGLIFVALFFTFRAKLAQIPFEPVQRIASISLADATVSSRLFIWKNISESALEKPLTGFGAEHVEILFNRFYDPGLIIEEWFDRSHNVYLDYFVQYGVFGFALYLALVVAALRAGMSVLKRDEVFGLCIMLATVVYAVQNFFVFDTALSLWLFFAIFAGAVVYGSKIKGSSLNVPRLPNAVPVGVAIAVLILIVPVSIQPLRANRLLADAYLYHVSDPARTGKSLEKGLSLRTYGDLEYGYQMYSMYTGEQLGMLKGESRIAAHHLAVQTLKQNFEEYPFDARTAVYYAHVLESVPPEVVIDEAELRRAIDRAKELSPKRMQPWFIEANLDLRPADVMPPGPARNARYGKGIALLEEYARLVPLSAEPRFVLASLYHAINDDAQAQKWADEGRLLYKGNPPVAKRAAHYYIAIEDWSNAARFLEESLSDTPNDYPVVYDLAKIRFLSGDVAGAQELVKRLRIESPGLVETDQAFLDALPK